MKENNIGRWSGKDKRLDGAVSYLLPAAAGFTPPSLSLYYMNLTWWEKERQDKSKQTEKLWSWRSSLLTCAGSGGGVWGIPARSLLSPVAVHNDVLLTAPPPKLHRKVMAHLHWRQTFHWRWPHTTAEYSKCKGRCNIWIKKRNLTRPVFLSYSVCGDLLRCTPWRLMSSCIKR